MLEKPGEEGLPLHVRRLNREELHDAHHNDESHRTVRPRVVRALLHDGHHGRHAVLPRKIPTHELFLFHANHRERTGNDEHATATEPGK